MHFWIKLKSVTLDKIGGKYVSVVLIRFVECFFRIFISQPLKIGEVWSTEFHFQKSNQRLYNEKKPWWDGIWFDNLIEFSRLCIFVDAR